MQTPQERLVVLERAKEIAHSAHKGQTRRWSGLPYITHPEAVAGMVKHLNQKTVAWLHDVLEDSPTTVTDLILAGIPRGLVEEVVVLTRRPAETYFNFIMRIMNEGIGCAQIVKIADITHNLSTMPATGQSTMRDKYELARYILQQNL